jgi:RES domain-containing protein
MTALREAHQVGALQPTTLVAYEADIGNVFDSRDAEALASQDMDAAAISAPTWRDEMNSHGESKTQAFARRLIESGRHGLLVRSFAAGSTAGDLNLVLWRWGDAAARLVLIDDEGRLSP